VSTSDRFPGNAAHAGTTVPPETKETCGVVKLAKGLIMEAKRLRSGRL